MQLGLAQRCQGSSRADTQSATSEGVSNVGFIGYCAAGVDAMHKLNRKSNLKFNKHQT